MIKVILSLIMLLLILISACYEPQVNPDDSEMVGIYISSREECLDSLEIRPDYTYAQFYKLSDGSLDSNVSTWETAYLGGAKYIYFSKKTEIIRGCEIRKSDGITCTCFLRSRSGVLKMVINDDLAVYYVKQK